MSNDQAQFSDVSATPASFALLGGNYNISVSADWNSGSVTLNVLSLDGVTWISVLPAFAADGIADIGLPPGLYQLAIDTATAVYASVSKIRQV